MNNHPGYAKAYWRDKARFVLTAGRAPQDAGLSSAVLRLREMLARREFDGHGMEATGDLRRVLEAVA